MNKRTDYIKRDLGMKNTTLFHIRRPLSILIGMVFLTCIFLTVDASYKNSVSSTSNSSDETTFVFEKTRVTEQPSDQTIYHGGWFLPTNIYKRTTRSDINLDTLRVTKDILSGNTINSQYNGFFLNSVNGTTNVSVKIDKKGVFHAVVAEWHGNRVFYGQCVSECGKSSNWLFIVIFNQNFSSSNGPGKVNLVIDSQDRPRVAFKVDGYGVNSVGYFYSECNLDCTSNINWKTVQFAQAGKVIASQSANWFLLDPQGHPRAVTEYTEFVDYLLNIRAQLYYNYCDTNCTESSNWSSILLTTMSNIGLVPGLSTSLVLNSKGQPRIGFNLLVSSSNMNAYYLECNTGCSSLSNWKLASLTNKWGYSFQMVIDAKEYLHIATGSSGAVAYLTCKQDCITPDNWQKIIIPGLPNGSGSGIGLILDNNDLPNMSYKVQLSSGESRIDFLYCSAGCENAETAEWHRIELEDTMSFDPLALYPGCTEQAWSIDGPVSLAIDPKGNSIFGYVASNIQGYYCVQSTPALAANVVYEGGRIGQFQKSPLTQPTKTITQTVTYIETKTPTLTITKTEISTPRVTQTNTVSPSPTLTIQIPNQLTPTVEATSGFLNDYYNYLPLTMK